MQYQSVETCRSMWRIFLVYLVTKTRNGQDLPLLSLPRGGWTRLTFFNRGLIRNAHSIMQSSLSMTFSVEATVVNFTIAPRVTGHETFMEGKFHHRWIQPGGYPFKVPSLSASSVRKSMCVQIDNWFSSRISTKGWNIEGMPPWLYSSVVKPSFHGFVASDPEHDGEIHYRSFHGECHT